MSLHVKCRVYPSLSAPEMMHFLGFPDLQLTDTDKLWIPLYAPPLPQKQEFLSSYWNTEIILTIFKASQYLPNKHDPLIQRWLQQELIPSKTEKTEKIPPIYSTVPHADLISWEGQK